jgi:hypothetical protein
MTTFTMTSNSTIFAIAASGAIPCDLVNKNRKFLEKLGEILLRKLTSGPVTRRRYFGEIGLEA